jgi:cobalt/nickel transport system permease protein
MHIPDGLLSAPVSMACATLSALAIGTAAARARARLGSRGVAMLGVTGAFIFAAQMLNFPVVGGTSAHLIGGVLAAVLLGPSTAVVVMTAVLVLQCLAFGDGGLLSLGANALNMAVVHPLVGYAAYRTIAGVPRCGQPLQPARQIAGAAFGAWVATIAGAAVCAGEIVLSRIGAPAVVLAAMVGVHAAVGVGEAVVTALVLATVLRVRPELANAVARAPAARRTVTAISLGLAASLALALFVSPFVCAWPDGLERLASRLGLDPSREHILFVAPMDGYAVHGIRVHVLSTSLAAAAGTLLVFGLCCALGWWLAPRRCSPADRAIATASRI